MKRKILAIIAGAIMATSCSKQATEIEPILDFALYTAPASNTITAGQTIEITCELHKSYFYTDGAEFTLQYEQMAGGGTLSMEGKKVEPNTIYTVPKGEFLLHYTAQGSDNHAIKLTVTDQSSNHEYQTIKFTNYE